MYGNQRPAAPWSFNNGWGQYPTYGDLPNVAGATLQLNDVQAGDIAWVVTEGALYVCQVPTRGAAVWAVGIVPDAVVGNLYVAPENAAASDDNAGTSSTAPLATLNRALELVNSLQRLDQQLIVHLSTNSSTPYTWGVVLGPLPMRAPLAIYGDGAGQAGDDGFVVVRATAAAAAGTGQRVVVDPTGGITVNSLVGKTIQILTGAAAGDLRTIRSNTAANIVPNRAFTAAVAVADTFRIVEPGVVITGLTEASLAGSQPSISGVGSPADVLGMEANLIVGVSVATLLLANVALSSPEVSASRFWIADSAVAFAGCEIRSTTSWPLGASEEAFVRAGTDFGTTVCEFVLPQLLGLAPNRTAWAGWGLHVTSQPGLPQFKRFRGFITHLTTALDPHVRDVRWVLVGGSFIGTVGDPDGFVRFESGSRIRIQGFDTLLPFLVACVGSTAASAGLRVVGGSSLEANRLQVDVTGNGVALVASGNEAAVSGSLQGGVISLLNGVALNAPSAGLVAMTSGRIYWDTAPTMTGTMTRGEAVITQSSAGGVAVVASTVAALADGAVIANPDLSGTIIGRIT